MRDEDRADKLARAIEKMVGGSPPEDLGDEELDEMLQIARIRLDAALMASQSGAATQGTVLERLLARLNVLRRGEDGGPIVPDDDPAEEFAPGDDDPEHVDVKELQDVIELRHRMAEHAAAVSEQHRDTVWQRVQARISAHDVTKRGFLRWPFGRRNRDADEFGVALDRMILGEPIWEAENSRLGELIQLAHVRRVSAIAGVSTLADQNARVWARLRPRLMARLMVARRPPVFERTPTAVPWPKLATAAAVVAVAVAAIGPLPTTGLAHHPAAEFARFVAGHIGVSETSSPPDVPPVTGVVQGSDVSAQEASRLLGLPVFQPTFVPYGYHEASARYFPKPITASEGGVYIIAYENSTATGSSQTILVFQERASLRSIAVEEGFAEDINLVGTGTAATYVSGTWRSLDGKLVWGEEGAQTLVFDSGGLRTIIQTAADDVSLPDLVAMGDSLAAQTAPTN